MSEQSQQPDVTGSTDHEQHRAGPGEGVRAPLVKDGGDHPEMSVFDGAGNETVVAITDDEAGRRSQGTGKSSAEALEDAKKPGEKLGKGFGTAH